MLGTEKMLSKYCEINTVSYGLMTEYPPAQLPIKHVKGGHILTFSEFITNYSNEREREKGKDKEKKGKQNVSK